MSCQWVGANPGSGLLEHACGQMSVPNLYGGFSTPEQVFLIFDEARIAQVSEYLRSLSDFVLEDMVKFLFGIKKLASIFLVKKYINLLGLHKRCNFLELQ